MKQLLEEVLYALEYSNDINKPDGLAGCNCPVCNVIPKVVAKLKELNEPASFKWYDGKGAVKVQWDCSEPVRMDWEKQAKTFGDGVAACMLRLYEMHNNTDGRHNYYQHAAHDMAKLKENK